MSDLRTPPPPPAEWGTLLIPLQEWEYRLSDQTLRVTMNYPVEEFRRWSHEEVNEVLERDLAAVKQTYLRCWESVQRMSQVDEIARECKQGEEKK
jgi:hypothetical protein